MGRRCVIAAWLLFMPAIEGAKEGAVLLDETVAVIAARIPSTQSMSIITRWELEAQVRIELIRRYGTEGVDKKAGKALRSEVLTTLIEETLVAMEMSRLGLKEVEESAVKEGIGELIEPFGGEEAFYAQLKKYGITPEHVRGWVERTLMVGDYIDAQFTMTGPVESGGTNIQIEKFYFKRNLVEDIKKRYRIWIFLK
jgi:hypothetical protein